MKTEEIKKQDELKDEQLDKTDHRDGSADPFSSTHYPVGAAVIYTTKKVMDILGNIGTH